MQLCERRHSLIPCPILSGLQTKFIPAAGTQTRLRRSTTNTVGATPAPGRALGRDSAAARNDADAKIAGKARPAFRIDGGNSNVPTVRPALREQASTIVPSVNVPNTR